MTALGALTAVRRTSVTVPAALVGATVLAQIAYPLTGGPVRDVMTGVVVLLAAAAAVTHAVLVAGRRGALAVVAAGAAGLLAEAVGVHTGRPFGHYVYSTDLGPQVAGVPWLVVAAWVSMAWPAATVARRLARRAVTRVALGAWALAAWDVFLDPQMVGEGHWRWAPGGYRLPGIGDVPVSNFAGWLAVAVVISLLVQRSLGPVAPGVAAPGPVGGVDPVGRAGAGPRDRAMPMYVYYVWTAASSALAALAFWHRPGVAAWGLVAMGPVALALLVSLRRRPA